MIDFFEFSNEMLCLADRNGYFTRVNRAWTTTLGWTSEELTSRPYVELVHPADRRATLREAEQLASGTYQTVSFENRYRTKAGTYRWLSWQATLIRDDGSIVASARDVTEQKQQTEALREAEESFRLLAANAPVGIAYSDAEGSVFYANKKWCEIAGVSPEGAIGFAWKNLVHPDDLPALLAKWNECLQAGEDMESVPFRFLNPSGNIRWALCSNTLLKDRHGVVTGQIGTIQDITHQKAAELHFRSIYEKAPLGIALLDSRSGRFLQVNQKYEDIIGYSEDEMRRLDFQRITYADDLQADLDQMEALRTGTIRHFHMEKRLLRKDGVTIWVYLTVVPMWLPDEPPTYHMALVEDITERRQQDQEIRKLSLVVEQADVAIVICTKEGRIEYVNRRAIESTGFSLDELRGQWPGVFHPFGVSPETCDEVWRTLQGGGTWRGQLQTTTKQGTLFWEQAVISPLTNELGEITHFISIKEDISELKQAEEDLTTERNLLRSLIDIQESEKQLVCHEFHDGLMQYVTGALMLLEASQAKPDQSALIKKAMSSLRLGMEDARRVIRGIRPALLDELGFESALRELVDQFRSPETMVTVSIDPELGQLPRSVQTCIYRVIQESLNNATKYSGSDVVRIELHRTDGEVQVSIQDFGCGFDVSLARKRGFGLVGMSERARLLGGQFVIESEIDSGTQIRVRLPLTDASPPAAEAAAQAQ